MKADILTTGLMTTGQENVKHSLELASLCWLICNYRNAFLLLIFPFPFPSAPWPCLLIGTGIGLLLESMLPGMSQLHVAFPFGLFHLG